MAGLKLRHIYKVYQGGVRAVNDFNLNIKDKSFVVLVGPSGCGKSTTLRMVAGLESITSGQLYIDDVLVNDTESKNRDIAMVFQSYALYPHMTVYQNMGFGLKLRHEKPEVIKEKVMKAAEILGLKTIGDIDAYSKEHGNIHDQALLAQMEQDVELANGEIDEDDFFNQKFESYNVYGEKLNEGKDDKFTCCICGEESYGYGNNPAPVKDEGRCCDACNLKFVIPARLAEFNKNMED